jgi:protein TonB
MRRAGIEGSVTIDFVVDKDGAVQKAVAVKSSRVEFEAPAVAAVSAWQFEPGQKGGRAVNTHMQVPIVFSLGTNSPKPGDPVPVPAPSDARKA